VKEFAMDAHSQISATISATTKDKLDRFTETHGFKKSFVVEQALLLFIEAHQELPDEAFIPTRIVLEDEGFERLARLIARPPEPPEALQELMRDPGR
jgi:hypothetical protein